MTASSHPTPRRGRLRHTVRTAAVALSLLLGATTLATVPSAAYADTPAPTPQPTETTETTPRADIVLVPDSQGRHTAGSPFAATIALFNPTDYSLDATAVTVKIARTPLTSRDALHSWLDSGEQGGTLTNLGSVSSPAVPAGGEDQAHLVLPVTALDGLAPGIYPLQATMPVTSKDDTRTVPSIATSRSVVVIGSTDTSTVTTVVPFTATPRGELLTANELGQLTGPNGALTTQLEAVRGTPAVLAVDPAIVAAIRTLGDDAPTSAVTWLDLLETLPNDRFSLQFLDADVSAQAAAGLTAPLSPESLDVFVAPRDLVDDDNESPSPSPAASEPAVEGLSVAELSAVPQAQGTVFWPRSSLTQNTADLIATYSDDPDSVIIVPSSSLNASPNSHPHATTGTASLLVADADVSTALSAAAHEGDTMRRGAHLVEATALLSFTPATTPTLVALDRDEDRVPEGLRAAAIAFSSTATPDLTTLTERAPRAAQFTTDDDMIRAEAINDLLRDERTLTSFASILVEPAQLIERERLRILRLLGVGITPTEVEFETAVAAHQARSQETLTAVGVQPLKPFLLSANVDLPVWVRNDLPYPITVVLTAERQDPRIDVQRTTVIHAPAGTIARDKIPVSARIASGEVDVVMSLTSRTGVPIGTPEVARLTVRADWENIGLGILASLVLLLLGGGIWRTVHQRRRNAQAIDPTDPDAPTAADDDDSTGDDSSDDTTEDASEASTTTTEATGDT